jgi:hypothetical protein
MARSALLRGGPLALALYAAFVLGLTAVGSAGADDEPPAKPVEDPIPPVVADEVAAEALEIFKTEFKASGKRGDEKLAAQAWALGKLAQVQHPSVVDELLRQTRHRDEDLRTAAVLGLGEQRGLAGYAGVAVLESLKRHMKDETFVMAALESIGKLRFLGAKKLLAELMRHPEYAIVKNALVTIARLKDARFIDEIIKLMKELKLEKGAKWDGVSVTYDTGAAGTHDQEMAEKIGKAAEAKNAKKGKRSAKSMRDLGPVVLEAMYELTGEQFSGGIEARAWLSKNRADVDARVAAVDKAADEQLAAAAAAKKR